MKINYVLMTAARNEGKYIEKLIHSIINQKILPNKWVIVSDGSTDKTNEIVKKYEKKYDFIKLLIKENSFSRNFSSKVHALQLGFNDLKDTKFDFIGNIDADISFEPNYFERVFKKFNQNSKLGIAGGWIYELKKGIYCARFGNNVLNVPGAIQMFRRKCYEEIDGYLPSKLGGEDTIAEVMAKMNGWEVKSFNDIKVLHHRPTGTGQSKKHTACFRFGVLSYSIGYDPFFWVARCVSRLGTRPYVIGSFFTMIGYVFAFIRKENRVVSDEFVKYLRNEQRQRLRKTISKFLGFMS